MKVDEYKSLHIDKQPKYRNVKTQRTMPNGSIHTFDSKREAEFYDNLMVLLKVGKIRMLRLQPQWTLQESHITSDGERVRAIRYTADFEYLERGSNPGEFNVHRVVDVKSPATRKEKSYVMKKKMMADKYGIIIQEI